MPRQAFVEPTEETMVRKNDGRPVDVGNWGYPGYLTREEWNVFVSSSLFFTCMCFGPFAFFIDGRHHPLHPVPRSHGAPVAHLRLPASYFISRSRALNYIYLSINTQQQITTTKHKQQQFKAEISQRPQSFQSTIYSFASASEDPTYAECRWLRARKFSLPQTLAMIEEAAAVRSSAGCPHFFPDGHVALGVEPSVYHTQYPQCYYSFARGGYPLFFSRVGMLNAEGLACVTTMRGILNYHWHDMMHGYTAQLERRRRIDPTFKRYEVVCVLDLEGLTTSHLTKRALDIVKAQTEMDSVCFPETLKHLVIINAPGFFPLTWKLIAKWIDARTANKVTILGSNRSKWMAKLRQLVDVDQLPVDYGGTGTSIERYLETETIEQYTEVHAARKAHEERRRSRQMAAMQSDDSQRSFCPRTLAKGQIVGQKAFHFSVRSAASHHASVLRDESMELSVFTRSVQGGKLRITSPAGRTVATVPIRHRGKVGGDDNDDDEPTRLDLDVVLTSPGRYKFKIESSTGLFGTEDFVLVTRVFGKDSDDHHLKVAASLSSLEMKSSDSSSEGLASNFVDVSLCHRELFRDENGNRRRSSVVASPTHLAIPPDQQNSLVELESPSGDGAELVEVGDEIATQQEHAPYTAPAHAEVLPSTAAEDRQPSETVEVYDGEDDIDAARPGLGFCGAFNSASTASLAAFFDLLCGCGSSDSLNAPASSHSAPSLAKTPSISKTMTDSSNDGDHITTMASF